MTIDEAISHEERNVEINKLIGEVSDCEPTNAIAYHRQLVEWINELKQLREQTRWIPVSERLPENESRVLVTIQTPMRSKVRSGMFDNERFYNDNGDTWKVTDKEVKAWMPLPKPYKAESEDKCKKCEYYINPDYTRCHTCKAESEDEE